MRGAVASIALEQPSESLEVGDCVVLEATARMEGGSRAEAVRIRWESSDATVVSVDAAGVLTAKAVGIATITASAGQVQSTAQIRVVAPEASTIEIDYPAEVRCGTRAKISGRALDRHGKPVDAPVKWTSRNPTIATVSDDGVVSAMRRGTAIVVAECAGAARAVTLTITSPPVVGVVVDGMPPALLVGSTTTLRAIVRTARSSEDDQDHPVEWRSSDPSIATISSAGTLTTRKVGRAVITATCGVTRGEAELNVVTVLAHSIVVAVPSSPLRVGDAAVLKATVYDAGGNAVSRPVAWRSSDARVAAVDQSGRITAHAEGWAIVTAQADAVESPVEILVRQQVVPVSASGRRESRRLALRWWLFLVVLGGVVALGWRLLRR